MKPHFRMGCCVIARFFFKPPILWLRGSIFKQPDSSKLKAVFDVVYLYLFAQNVRSNLIMDLISLRNSSSSSLGWKLNIEWRYFLLTVALIVNWLKYNYPPF